VNSLLLFVGGGVTFVTLLLGYCVARMLRADGWDQSNVFNALRVLSYVTMHPGRLIHLRDEDGYRPFWYAPHDEFSKVVNRDRER